MLVRVRHRHPGLAVRALQRDADDLFRAVGFGRPLAPPAAAPFTVTRDADGVTVRAEIPGVEPAAIAVSVEGRTLSISAERPPEEGQTGRYRLRERASDRLSQTLRLSDDLDADAISAEAKYGVLTVRIPTRPEVRPRQIPVTVG